MVAVSLSIAPALRASAGGQAVQGVAFLGGSSDGCAFSSLEMLIVAAVCLLVGGCMGAYLSRSCKRCCGGGGGSGDSEGPPPGAVVTDRGKLHLGRKKTVRRGSLLAGVELSHVDVVAERRASVLERSPSLASSTRASSSRAAAAGAPKAFTSAPAHMRGRPSAAGLRRLRVIYDKVPDGTVVDELHLRVGAIVLLHEEDASGWWRGALESEPSRVGVFPHNYVEDA
eukprot:PLAT2429.1.p1 GENE.PLAT2429.1~~PLAT2429.1.p1  ORF type:complete len:227 (-),score=65.85 PLAT2429.1:70-750(-)